MSRVHEDTNEAKKWRKESGVIYFSVASSGVTKQKWLDRWLSQNRKVSDISSFDFVPTTSVIFNMVILPGVLFEQGGRATLNITSMAQTLGFLEPTLESAFLIRDFFSDEEIKEMGLCWVAVMYNPSSADGVLIVHIDGSRPWFYPERPLHDVEPGAEWGRVGGFAFLESITPVVS